MMKPTRTTYVTGDCVVVRYESGLLVIGQDLSMNGIDAPAHIRSLPELLKLIDTLTRIAQEWK